MLSNGGLVLPAYVTALSDCAECAAKRGSPFYPVISMRLIRLKARLPLVEDDKSEKELLKVAKKFLELSKEELDNSK